MLVSMCNLGAFTVPATLICGGVIVSGQIVSGKKYFDHFAETFSKGFSTLPPEDVEEIRENLAHHGDIYERKEGDNRKPTHTIYVHLKDAKYYSTTGQAIPTSEGLWFRGRLSEVSGFHLGALAQR